MAAQLTAIVEAVPSGVNPYLFVSEALLESFVPPTRSTFYASLKVNSVFLALGFIMSVVSLGAKLFQPNARWLFRFRATPQGRLLTANTTTVFLICSMYFTAMAQAWTWLIYRCFHDHQEIKAMEAIHGWVWIGMVWAVWVEAWGMGNASYLASTQSNKTRFRIPAWVVNAYFVLVPLAYVVSQPTFFAIAAASFGEGVDTYYKIAAGLQEAAASWDGQSPFVPQASWLPLLLHFVEVMQDDFSNQMRRGYACLLFFTATATLTFIAAAFQYMSTLRLQMRTAMPQHRIDSINGVGQTAQLQFLRDLRLSYRLLVLATISFAFLGGGYTVLAAAPVVNFTTIFTTPMGIEIQLSMALYIYSFLGAPTTCVILWKTYKSFNKVPLRAIFPASPNATSKSKFRQPAYTGVNAPPESYAAMLRAINVHTEVQVAVDQADEYELDDDKSAKLRVGVLEPEDRALARVKEQMDALFTPF